jgi:phosphohistidine phosphatase SixA
MVSRRRFLAGALALGASAAARPDDDEAALWRELRAGGLVVLIRHASTVAGLGDPEGFRLGDCSTQRNLSEAGREESRRIGARFRSEGVAVQEVLTSPWCRCRDTAMLAFGRAEDWEPLSSFFDYPHREPEFSERVRKRIASYQRRKMTGNVVMVTHNVNIAALSRHSVAPGEMVLMRPDGCCDARPKGRLRA